MTILNRPSPVVNRPPDESPSTPRDATWFVRVPVEFLDDRKNPIPRRHRKMLLLLDGRCRDKSWCFVGNEEGAAEYGCTPGHFRILIVEMEREGTLDRVIESRGKTKRFGLVLRRRVDPGHPVADTDEARAEAADHLLGRSRARKSATCRARKSATYRARFCAPESESCSKQTKENQTVVREGPPRRRPDPDRDAATDSGAAEGRAPDLHPPNHAAHAADPPEGLTPGQAEFLAGLTADRRARFDAWPETRRAATLAMFARGLDRLLLGEALQSLAPPRASPIPPPDAPTPELIAALSGPAGRSIAPRCADAIISDLGDRNRSRSFGPVLNLCGEVAAGARDPDSLAVPLARTVEAIARGEPIRNPGAFWTRSVQNWDRERPGGGP